MTVDYSHLDPYKDVKNSDNKYNNHNDILHISEIVNKELINNEWIDLSDLDMDERVNLGIFVTWQNPVEIPGITNFQLLHSVVAEHLDDFSFLRFVMEKLQNISKKTLDVLLPFLDRNVHHGLSGGEKKKVEMLHACILEPRILILDELDSGLDVDAFKEIVTILKDLKKARPRMAILVISHYKKMMECLSPDRVLLLKSGRIVREGGIELLQKIEETGYTEFHI